MKVNEIVSFSKESFFNGAVQTEWFYDNSKVGHIAESYVFHGPKYYGVSETDVSSGEHRLLDTASFTMNLTTKLYTSKPDNNFIMTIAGYGTGKSHMAVCLGALFSEEGELRESIIRNISAADKNIGEYIREKNTARNLVIVLNGMNNFNLDAEILRCARLSLARCGIGDELLQKLTKSYNVAKHFVEHMFALCKEKFNTSAQNYGLQLSDTALKNYLISHVESDNKILDVINTVYEEVNGDKITWDRGLSAGDVLLTLQEELCGDGKPYNKILLLFDEFGRYIEYTAANPSIAGEASLQQIFEAIQAANGKIIFSGFIQSELKAYLSRIEKTSNITRYIDRYRTACENLFLSSNFETILANILKKSNPEFDHIVGNAISHYDKYHSKIKNSLSRWDRTVIKKSVWTSNDLYNNVILKGCYPLHPITVWLLSSSHQWMQQRSTLAFAAEMFEQVSPSEIYGTWLPYIYPIQIIDSGIFNEMLNSEEKGLVSSQYCMLYRDIMVKIGDKLSELEKTILKAILIINIGRMVFRDKDDAILAIHYCSNVSEDDVNHALKSLEDMHGVIAFDEHSNTFDLIAEANGFNEFRRTFAKYRLGVKVTIDDLDENVLEQISITTPIETSFGQDNHISSTEWGFEKRLIDSTNISNSYLCEAIKSSTNNCDGEKLRGILIYAYCHENSEQEIYRISSLYNELELAKYPVIVLFLDDSEGEILASLAVKKALQKFSVADKERFEKHILNQQRAKNNTIIRNFTQCVSKRTMISSNGLEQYSVRINALCTQCFTRLFTQAVPFPFDGFENKIKTQAKSTLITLCVNLLNQTITNAQVYSSLTPKDKNRVAAVLSTKSPNSWKVFDDNCQLVDAMNPLVNKIIKEIEDILESDNRTSMFSLFGKFQLPPYGMNDNAIALMASYFIAFHGNKYLYSINNERLSSKHWTDTKGRLKLPEFKRIMVRKNPNVNKDVIEELCKKILSTTTVEQCATMRINLEELIAQEGETESNKYLIAQAKTHLDEGERIRKTIYERISKAQILIEEVSQKFSIIKTVKAFSSIPTITPVIENGFSFIYSDTYKQLTLKLKEKAKALLDNYYIEAIKKQKCNITELSQFKTTYSKISMILRENGYEVYAVATDTRLKEVEAELLAKQHYESSLIECEKDLTLSATTDKYQDCDILSKKFQSWITFIENTKDLPSSISEPLLERIRSQKSSKEKQMTSIIQEYEATIKSLDSASTVIALRQIESKLDRLEKMQLPEEKSQSIVVIRESIFEALNTIARLPDDIDLLEDGIKKNISNGAEYCCLAIKSCAEEKQRRLKTEESDWIARYIDSAEKTYQTMSTQECLNWMERTKKMPSFISKKTQERYATTIEKIDKQLHAAKVKGLLSMYDALTPSEKLEFKELLSQR